MNQPLTATSPTAWLDAVLADFDAFLIDHAANEKKASAAAMSLIAHYPDKPELVETMSNIALEEMQHYRQVIKLVLDRGLVPRGDEKDPYVNAILKKINKGPEDYFLDRLLTGAIIEARGAERFARIAEGLESSDQPNGQNLFAFYQALARSELHHYETFLRLAEQYFPRQKVADRWQFWLEFEADLIQQIPIRARLH